MATIRHKIPAKDKDRAWRREFIRDNAARAMNNFYGTKDLELLDACSGKFDKTGYSYITNPMGLKDPKYQNYPAKLINWDFITPIFRRLNAQYSERVNEPEVYTRNSNFDSDVSQAEVGLITESLQQTFINVLIKSGKFDPILAQQQQEEEPISPEAIKQKVSSMKDLVSIEGQHVLNYVIDHQKLNMKYRAAWDSFVKINKFITFKDVRHDSVVVNNVFTRNARFYGNKSNVFLEDAEVVCVDYHMTFLEVMELFQDVFEEDEYKKEYGDISSILENSNAGDPMSSGMNVGDFMRTYSYNRGIDMPESRGMIDTVAMCKVTHVQATSFVKVGLVYDVENDKIVEVTEDYLGDDAEWVWYPEEREGWAINDTYHIGGYPNDIQLRDPDNPFSTKKNYNGRIFMQGESAQLTIAQMLMHHQEAYNVIKYKIQLTINKNKDKLLLLPIGLLGHMKTGGSGKTYYSGELDEDGRLAAQYNPNLDQSDNESAIAKALYYAESTGVLFIDETAEGAALAAQMIKSVDLSLGNYIEYLMKYALAIKQEAEEYIGFNRFMMSKTSTNDAVGAIQQGIYNGSMVIEEFFTQFEEALQVEYQGIIDRGRYAFKVGKKASYVRSNTDRQVLKVTENLQNHMFGVFVRSGAKSKELREAFKERANEVLQNGLSGSVSSVFKVLSNTMNYNEIVQEIEAAEEKMMQQQQATEQRTNEAMVEAEQIKADTEAKKLEFQYWKAQLDAQTKMFDSLQESQSFIGSSGKGDDALPEIQKNITDIVKNVNDSRLKAADIQARLKMNKEDNDTKRYVADKSVTVAVTNK